MTITARTRTVQNILERPGTGEPAANRQVVVRLNSPAWLDDGQREKVLSRYATTDADGLWSVELEVNDDIDPAGSYYTVQELPGSLWLFAVPAGDGVVWLRDCLTVTPPQGPPVVTIKGAAGDNGAPGLVQTLVQGAGIAIDNSDPVNPVISTTLDGTPTGPAGGDLTGSYPDPELADPPIDLTILLENALA